MTPVHKLKLTLLNLGTTRSISTKSFSEDCSPNAKRNFFKFQALLLSCEMIKSIITIILIPISFLEMDDLSHVNLHSPIRPKPSTNIYPLPRLFFVYLLLSSLPLFTFCLCLCCNMKKNYENSPESSLTHHLIIANICAIHAILCLKCPSVTSYIVIAPLF